VEGEGSHSHTWRRNFLCICCRKKPNEEKKDFEYEEKGKGKEGKIVNTKRGSIVTPF